MSEELTGWSAGLYVVSSPGEFHPQALSEPYVSLSTHTAPSAQPPHQARRPRPRLGILPLKHFAPSGCPDPARAEPPVHLRSSPITGPSSLLRAPLPLCPASVLRHLWCPPLAPLPLHRDDRFSRSSPEPDPASRRLYAGRRVGTKQVTPHPCPRAITPPWFRRRFRHLDTSSDGSLSFVSLDHT